MGYGTRAEVPAIKPFGTTLEPLPQDKTPEKAFKQDNPAFETFRGPHSITTINKDGDVKDSKGDGDDITPVATKPFAKIDGQIIWIPFYGKLAKMFFTSSDYAALTSEVVQDGGVLKLKAPTTGTLKNMKNTIKEVRESLRSFGSMEVRLIHGSLTTRHAEWLELRQLLKAIAKYQKTTTGMYNQAGLFSGNLREAVQKAIDETVGVLDENRKDRIRQNPSGPRGLDAPGAGTSALEGSATAKESTFSALNPFQPLGAPIRKVHSTLPTFFNMQ